MSDTTGRRVRHAKTVEAGALCRECGWRRASRNAVALAARHTDTTGHPTEWTQTIAGIYRPQKGRP